MAETMIASSQNQQMILKFDTLTTAYKKPDPVGIVDGPSDVLVASERGLTPLQGATFAFWLLLTTNNTSSTFDYSTQTPFSFKPSNLLYRLAPMFKNLRGDLDQAIDQKFTAFTDLLVNDGMNAEVTLTDANGVSTKTTAFISYSVGVEIARSLFSRSSEMGDTADEEYEGGQICDGDRMFMGLIPANTPIAIE